MRSKLDQTASASAKKNCSRIRNFKYAANGSHYTICEAGPAVEGAAWSMLHLILMNVCVMPSNDSEIKLINCLTRDWCVHNFQLDYMPRIHESLATCWNSIEALPHSLPPLSVGHMPHLLRNRFKLSCFRKLDDWSVWVELAGVKAYY